MIVLHCGGMGGGTGHGGGPWPAYGLLIGCPADDKPEGDDHPTGARRGGSTGPHAETTAPMQLMSTHALLSGVAYCRLL